MPAREHEQVGTTIITKLEAATVNERNDEFLFIVALRDTFQGFEIPDIKTIEGLIGVLPAFGTEEQARAGVRALNRTSGVPENQFRVCRYRFDEAIECGGK